MKLQSKRGGLVVGSTVSALLCFSVGVSYGSSLTEQAERQRRSMAVARADRLVEWTCERTPPKLALTSLQL